MFWEYTCEYPYYHLPLQLLAGVRYEMQDNVLYFSLFSCSFLQFTIFYSCFYKSKNQINNKLKPCNSLF